jgi:hypothetical protein
MSMFLCKIKTNIKINVQAQACLLWKLVIIDVCEGVRKEFFVQAWIECQGEGLNFMHKHKGVKVLDSFWMWIKCECIKNVHQRVQIL